MFSLAIFLMSQQNSDMISMVFPLISSISINCRINLFLKAQEDSIEIIEEFRSDFQLAFVLWIKLI